MNDLQIFSNSTNKTPIEVLLQVCDDGTVSARNIYAFLELSPRSYARWCKTNIIENEFAEEGTDFIPSALMLNGGLTTDYKLSVPFAKKLCMLSKTDRGEQARDYFVKVENTLKNVAQNLPQLSQNELILQIAQANVELEKRMLTIEESQHKFEQKLDTAIKVFSVPNIDHWKADMDNTINRMVDEYRRSPSGFRALLYRELEEIANVKISRRLSLMRTRLKQQGVTYKERQAVTKLDVISKDKKLRLIFEGVVKKYQAMYGVVE